MKQIALLLTSIILLASCTDNTEKTNKTTDNEHYTPADTTPLIQRNHLVMMHLAPKTKSMNVMSYVEGVSVDAEGNIIIDSNANQNLKEFTFSQDGYALNVFEYFIYAEKRSNMRVETYTYHDNHNYSTNLKVMSSLLGEYDKGYHNLINTEYKYIDDNTVRQVQTYNPKNIKKLKAPNDTVITTTHYDPHTGVKTTQQITRCDTIKENYVIRTTNRLVNDTLIIKTDYSLIRNETDTFHKTHYTTKSIYISKDARGNPTRIMSKTEYEDGYQEADLTDYTYTYYP